MRLLSFILALAVSACATATPAGPPASPPGPQAGPNCLPDTADAKHLTFGPGKLTGVVWGSGKTAVVLAHQNGGSICQWVEPARALVAQGYLVLAFDFGGFGGSPLSERTPVQEVTDAVEAARAQGATGVALVGASMGGTYSVTAAAGLTPAVLAVVSLSAPATFGGANAEQAAPKLAMPVLWVAAASESSYADAARRMHAVSPGSQLLIVPGIEHGVSLVTEGLGSRETIETVTNFVKEHAPPA